MIKGQSDRLGETLSFPVLQKQPQYQDISREAGKTEMVRNVKDKSTSQRSKMPGILCQPPDTYTQSDARDIHLKNMQIGI